MAGTSQAKTIPNPPGVTLKHLAKTQEEMRAQLKTLMLEQNEQTRELRAIVRKLNHLCKMIMEGVVGAMWGTILNWTTMLSLTMVMIIGVAAKGPDPNGWAMKSVKIDAPTFNGQMDPQVFSD